MSGAGKTVFVTGGGGYVASHSIVELLKEDFNVIAVDNFINSIKGRPNPILSLLLFRSARHY